MTASIGWYGLAYNGGPPTAAPASAANQGSLDGGGGDLQATAGVVGASGVVSWTAQWSGDSTVQPVVEFDGATAYVTAATSYPQGSPTFPHGTLTLHASDGGVVIAGSLTLTLSDKAGGYGFPWYGRMAWGFTSAPPPPPPPPPPPTAPPPTPGRDYVHAILQLFPRGPAWPRDSDAGLTKVATALAAIYTRTDARALALLVDAFPRSAVELLPEWEAAVGVPGPFGVLASTVAGQQAQVVKALTDAGGQSIPYFIGLLADLGVTATIVQFTRFTVRKPVGSPINGDGWAHSWRVDIAGSRNAAIESLIQLFAPAHTVVAFTYH